MEGIVSTLGFIALVCAAEPSEIVTRPIPEPPAALDGQPRFEVIRTLADGTVQTLADRAVAVVTVDDEPWLVTPDRTLLRVSSTGEREILDHHVVVPPVAFDDSVAWVAGNQSYGEIKLHHDGTTRVAARGLTAVSSLRFTPEARHLLVVAAGPGGVAGLHVVDVHQGFVRCLTNCDLQVGTSWQDRFLPPPPVPDALEFSGDDVAWAVEGRTHVVRWRLEWAAVTARPDTHTSESPALPFLSVPPIVRPMILPPPPEFYGSLTFPIRCADGGQSCVYMANRLDLHEGNGLEDYNCMGGTYDGHRGYDYVKQGTTLAKVVAAGYGTVTYVTDGYFDQCTGCVGGAGDCSFQASNDVVVDQGQGVWQSYGHMKKGSIKVKVGDKVTCGQEIGEVASSGCSDAPHLHFGIIRDFTNSNVHDPYAGPCSPTPESMWVEQGTYPGLPGAVDCPIPPCPEGSERWHCEATGTGRERCVDGSQEIEPCPAGWSCDDGMDEAQCIEPPPDPTSGETSSTSDEHSTTSGEAGSAASGSGTSVDDDGSHTSTTEAESDSQTTLGGDTSGGPNGTSPGTFPAEGGTRNTEGCACTAIGNGMGSTAWWSASLMLWFRNRRPVTSRILVLFGSVLGASGGVACSGSDRDPPFDVGASLGDGETSSVQSDGTASAGPSTAADSDTSSGVGTAGTDSSSAGSGETSSEGGGDEIASDASSTGMGSEGESTGEGYVNEPCPEALDGALMAQIQPYVDHVEATAPGLISDIVPSIVVAVVGNGEVAWTRAYGQADKAAGTPASADATVYQVASISKTVTAWGVMKAVEMGLMDLDAPVEQYLTSWRFPPSEYDSAEVTVRRLLSHTGGTSIAGYGTGYHPNDPLPTVEESLNAFEGGVRIVIPPGTEYRYSGGGYTVLQLALEDVTGETFTEFMDREILAAVGMEHSSFSWLDEIKPLTAKAYNDHGTMWPNFLFAEKAAAGLYTTVTSLAKFVAAGMENKCGAPAGRGILTPASVDAMHTAQPATNGGYGLGHDTVTIRGMEAVYHTGWNAGWRAVFYAIPDMQAGVVALTNGNSPVANDAVQTLACDWISHVPKGSC